jgi:hypothetical protein
VLIIDPQTYEVTMDAGDQERIQFTLTNSDGTAFNGTGATFELTAKHSLDDAIGAAAFRITSSGQPSQYDLALVSVGIIIIELLPANTSGLGGKRLTLGLRVTDSATKPHTPRVSSLIVRKNPTT